MKKCILGLSLTLTVLLAASPAQAQIFFRKPRTAPETPQTPMTQAAAERQKITEAMFSAKNDPDERKRSRAIVALDGVDAKSYPETLSLLADIAARDPQPHLRTDALSSLARIRPMSALAAQTLDKAADSDTSWRNRVHAKTLSLRYNLYYRPSKDEPLAAAATQVPPLAAPTVTNRVPTGSSGLPIIRDAETVIPSTPNFGGPAFAPSETIPTFKPAIPPPMVPSLIAPNPVVPPMGTIPSDGPPRFVPLPKFGIPRVVDAPAETLIPIVPSIPTKEPVEVPLPPSSSEPEIVIPILPGAPSPAPGAQPAIPATPATPLPIETGPILGPLPGITTAPAPMPTITIPTPSAPAPGQPPRAPVQPTPQDDVVLPPKF